ncbi:MAG TPA: glutathione S-transferase [Burkholderiales bacterium]|nr:glutathione S-transferase [Burkholderiales bacterium]
MKPVLYTFRRCPYAIRARLAIKVSGIEVEMREVDLRNKPQSMLACSPKGTVPVLQLADGAVIEESLDIMRWALAINDPHGWMEGGSDLSVEALTLVDQNDGSFKRYLDRYKYAERYPEHPADYHREQAEVFLSELESRLGKHTYLTGERPSVSDAAIFPFVRQFAHVDREWFYASRYERLKVWLDGWLQSSLFEAVMRK